MGRPVSEGLCCDQMAWWSVDLSWSNNQKLRFQIIRLLPGTSPSTFASPCLPYHLAVLASPACLPALSDLPVSVKNPCPVGKAESNEAHSKPTDLSFSVNKTVSFREPAAAHNGHSNCNGTCRNTQYLTDLPVHPHLHKQAQPKPENHPRSPVPSRRQLDGRSSLQVPTIAPPGLTHCPTKTQ